MVAGLIGTLLRQLPAFALRDPAAYATQMDEMHRIYDPLTFLGFNLGPGLVDVFERLGFFRVFSAPWFTFLLTLLVVSIVVCTLDRTPRLWRSVHRVNVVQPPVFYDLRRPERAHFDGLGAAVEAVGAVETPAARAADGLGAEGELGAADESSAGGRTIDELRRTLRGRRYRLREVEQAGVRHFYGDRNQYFKMATLLTHLGLILFLAGGAVTTAFGFETVVFVGEGQTAPVQAVGTPDNLLVKNIHFEAPTRPDGSFADFRTDLAVYQNGREIARKTIRVNDPLTVNGFVFHQNTFGPAADLVIRDGAGRLLWDGPVLLAGELAGLPQGFITVPGTTTGLLLVLDRTAEGAPLLVVAGVGPAGETGESSILFTSGLGLGRASEPDRTGGLSVTWEQAGAYTGMVIKRDPGQGLIWVAYLSLISGLALTFYFPRRRVWARLHAGRLELAFAAERYVNAEREFDDLLDELGRRLNRRPMRRAATAPTSG